ncbi:hypothetical protein T11_15765 [Trichinella zimbabwensis]|uniref:Uncharacterized protein n=1 Tax=Trichinella zimbabwensis TaxID=268475 RepID=A0A0V1HL80_9BILA|nr:hypothetical protein T11_15765 [Trichinella zimbabwensis]
MDRELLVLLLCNLQVLEMFPISGSDRNRLDITTYSWECQCFNELPTEIMLSEPDSFGQSWSAMYAADSLHGYGLCHSNQA